MASRTPHYVGIAALVTAISTALLGFWQFYVKTQYNENMMRSMFAMINYRLIKIEKKLDIEPPVFFNEKVMSPIVLSSDERVVNECSNDTECRGGFSCTRGKCRLTKKMLSFDTIQMLVNQTGKPLDAPSE